MFTMWILTFVCLCHVVYVVPDTTDVIEISVITDCREEGNHKTVFVDYQEKCVCDFPYYYNETTKTCTLNLDDMMHGLMEKHHTQEKIRVEAEKIFDGILISVLLFVTCTCIGILCACFYCFRIHYRDYKLEKEVKVFAKKLGRDSGLKKIQRKPLTNPIAESCNVMVEDAGVFVV